MTAYDIARGGLNLFMRSLWRLEVTGLENVPITGPLVVACNHVSYVDPVALGCALPRPFWYMAKSELFAIPVLGPAIALVNAFPVDRSKGGLAAIRKSVSILKEGKAIGIFPEGTRNLKGEAEEKGGAALLASLSGALVLPAAVVGSARASKLGKIRVAFGQPIRVERNRKAAGDDLEKWTQEIMSRIRGLEEQIGAHSAG
jgi:1-acyl-sn-glycerol-3-phosphate acyltransferase